MVSKKIACTWTIDRDVEHWINNKVGKNSQFVNRILLREMRRELERRESPKKMCPECYSVILGDGDCSYCAVV